jgi:hypothetical protein
VPKQNYHQARKQKELARKTRQQEKQQKRSARQALPPDHPEALAAMPSSAVQPEVSSQEPASTDLLVGGEK